MRASGEQHGHRMLHGVTHGGFTLEANQLFARLGGQGRATIYPSGNDKPAPRIEAAAGGQLSIAHGFLARYKGPSLGLKEAMVVCRSIKILFNFAPPATDEEIRAASLQFVRKLSGFSSPSQANRAAFDRAVDEVAASARTLIGTLVTTAEPRDREIEAERARAKAALRFGVRPGS
jgi:hypothetical protein